MNVQKNDIKRSNLGWSAFFSFVMFFVLYIFIIKVLCLLGSLQLFMLFFYGIHSIFRQIFLNKNLLIRFFCVF
jgi:hypothetical protein